MRDLIDPYPYVTDGCHPLPQAWHGSVLLLGSFDGMHRGHMALVDRARRLGTVSILQCDPHPRQFFRGGSRFRIATGQAQRRLLALAGIDLIFAPRFDADFADQAPEAFIARYIQEHLCTRTVVVGADFRFGRGATGDVETLRRAGLDVHVIGDALWNGRRVASTDIRAAIRTGRIREANALLGRSWLTEAAFSPDQCLPPDGAWQVCALDRDGAVLAETVLHLAAGSAVLDTPCDASFLEWIDNGL